MRFFQAAEGDEDITEKFLKASVWLRVKARHFSGEDLTAAVLMRAVEESIDQTSEICDGKLVESAAKIEVIQKDFDFAGGYRQVLAMYMA